MLAIEEDLGPILSHAYYNLGIPTIHKLAGKTMAHLLLDYSHQSTQSPWKLWSEGRTIHAVSDEEITILNSSTLPPLRGSHGLTQVQTLRLINEAQLLYKLSLKEASTSDKNRTRSLTKLPFVVFNDIDKTLFAGVLKGNVYLKWSSLEHKLLGVTASAGVKDRPRISIELSDQLLSTSSDQILATLMHHMLHAYLLQCCGHKNAEGAPKGHDLEHSMEFSALSLVLQRWLLPPLNKLYPASFGCVHEVGRGSPRRRDSRSHRGHRDVTVHEIGADCSYCDGCHNGYNGRECAGFLKHLKDTADIPTLDLKDSGPKDSKGIPRSVLSAYADQFGDLGSI